MSIGGTTKPLAHDAVVVYEHATGRIVHVHEVITMPGGIHPEHSAMSARAVEIVGNRGRHSVGALATLIVPANAAKRTKHARVDAASQTLVESVAAES